jgi:ATP-binding cassette subfamily F protein 2
VIVKKKPGPPKKKPMRAMKLEQEAAARAKKIAAEEKLAAERREASGGRLSQEELGFFQRSGPDVQIRRANSNMDIQISNVQLYGGRQELLSDATLRLVFGKKARSGYTGSHTTAAAW